MAIKCAVVHASKAHRDEFFALGLALHTGLIQLTTPVYRRNPTEDELKDPEVLVLDVGMCHEPMLSNFDHHQFRRGTLECTLSLLAKHLFVSEGVTFHDLLEEHPWYRTAILADTRGGDAVAREHGLQKYPIEFSSAIDQSILEQMKEGTGVTDNAVDTLILRVAKLVIDRRVEAAVKLKTRFVELDKKATFIPIKNINNIQAGFNAIWFDGDNFGINAFRAKNDLKVAVSICHAGRTEGWALFRYDDDPRIDFSRLQGHEQINFAHVGGFLAETNERLDREALIVLLSQAMTDQPVVT